MRLALLSPALFVALFPTLASAEVAPPPASPAAATPSTPSPAGLGGAGGLSGLGSGGLMAVDPKAIAFETEVLAAVNAARAAASVAPVAMDERLRAFARNESQMTVRDSVLDAKATGARLKEQNLGGVGFRFQFAFGPEAKPLVADLLAKPGIKDVLLGEFQRAGVGAAYVPAKRPFFQITLVLVRDPDPMFGKPGLSPEQTDPVINASQSRVRACYDAALKSDPNLRGDALIEITIGAAGTVDDAKLRKPLGLPAFDDCALGVARSLVFPKPYKGRPVSLFQPMRFTPPQGDKRVGRLTDTQISGTFGLNRDRFKECYTVRSIAKPNLQGVIALALTIGADGAVSAAVPMLDEPGDAEFTRCVVEQARALRFPRPEFDAPVDITYRLTFHHEE